MVMTIELLACLWLAPLVELGAAEQSAKKNAENAIKKLYAEQEAAETLSKTAKAIMVFPNVFKAGFIGGAHYGEGVLFRDGKAESRYSSVAGSFGLQAGVQVFGYELFFMSDRAFEYLEPCIRD
jgi:lipid-binding SYLF domain-containing protein